jgi:hypothetical protein
MGDTAISTLFDLVADRFTAEGTDAVMLFGWLAAAQQIPGNHIVWSPGDTGGVLGAWLPPKYPGRNPRTLANLAELVTIEIAAVDNADHTNERKQYLVAHQLFEATMRAVHLAAHGTYKMLSATWIDPKTKRSGAALRVVISVESPIVDTARGVAPVDTGAHIGVHSLDVTEIAEVTPA